METTKIKLRKPILQPSLPKTRPENSQPDYLESLQLNLYELFLTNWDQPPDELENVRRQSHRKLYRAELRLAEARQREIDSRDKVQEQWTEVYGLEKTLRTHFIIFSQFLSENSEKRKRAMRTVLKKGDRVELVEEMTKVALAEQEIYRDLKVKMEEWVDRRRYGDFLKAVVDMRGSGFKCIDDIFNKYRWLSMVRERIGERALYNYKETEKYKLRIENQLKEVENRNYAFRNQHSDLTTRLHNARTNSLHWESVVQGAREAIVERRLQVALVKASAANLYAMSCQRRRQSPQFDPQDTPTALHSLKGTLEVLKLMGASFSTTDVIKQRKRLEGNPQQEGMMGEQQQQQQQQKIVTFPAPSGGGGSSRRRGVSIGMTDSPSGVHISASATSNQRAPHPSVDNCATDHLIADGNFSKSTSDSDCTKPRDRLSNALLHATISDGSVGDSDGFSREFAGGNDDDRGEVKEKARRVTVGKLAGTSSTTKMEKKGRKVKISMVNAPVVSSKTKVLV